jgi:hypothetical protein
MESFCTDKDLIAQRKRVRFYSFLFAGLCAVALAFFVTLCLITRTGNAAATLRAAIVGMILLGFACITVWVCLLSPARLKLTHLEGLASQAPEAREGRFFLTAESFQIPRSVRVRRARLEAEGESLPLNLDEAWVSRVPENGSLVRVLTVRKFITGMEVIAPPGAPVPEERTAPAPGRAVARILFRLIPLFILWGMMVPIFAGFVFTRITDTDPAHKITVYADAELRDAAKLAARLEESVSGPVRMVKVHPFTYALFGSDALKQADLYIVPASHAEEYRDWFTSPPEEVAALASDRVPGGIPVFDPATGLNAAGAYILYTAPSGNPEPYYLFFGAGSPHLADHAAADAAKALLAVTD